MNALNVSQFRGKALVADDEPSNRFIVCALMRRLNYEIIEASNGADAVKKAQMEEPDIILMDVMMPVMDGLEAAKRIKEWHKDTFVPIIFITALTDNDTLTHCINVGGDDFLSKPFSHTLLKTKVFAMERIRDLQRKVSTLYKRMQADEDIAERVFSGAVISGNIATDTIESQIRSADLFSGDVLLTAYTPNGDLHILLGDFTGHGLAAALGAMPTAEVFRSMSGKGFSAEQILESINNKLCTMLPTGMFLAAQFYSIDSDLELFHAFNCGLPAGLLIDGNTHQIKERIDTKGVPLGIIKNKQYSGEFKPYPISPGDSLIFVSDGVAEARNQNGEMFGQDRFEEVICNTPIGSSIYQTIDSTLQKFCMDAPQEDDISIVSVPLIDSLVKIPDSIIESKGVTSVTPTRQTTSQTHYQRSDDGSSICLTLHGEALKRADPVPLMLSQLQELFNLESERSALFTILTELYSNALNHGILGLNSSIKSHRDGFVAFYKEREKRLATLENGYTKIEITIHKSQDGQREISISMEDSGAGFDFKAREESIHSENMNPSGRGINIVKELCQSLEYNKKGNRVSAIYMTKS